MENHSQQLGNYRFIRPLGQGSFARAYLGEHISLKKRVAVKVLRAPLSREDQERFLAEMQTIDHLKHPNILPVREYGVLEGIPFLVMPYASGGSLRQRHPRGAGLTPLTILPYIRQIAAALQSAHNEGIIHRNLKPENVLLDLNDTVFLSDFGLAIGQQSSRSQSMQEIANAAIYMAPELLQGKPLPASDQYALGIVVYEWLCGTVPFEGSFTEIASKQFSEPPPAMQPLSVSSEVEVVVMKALSKDPEQRFATIQEFAHAFERAVFQEEATVRARPGAAPSPASVETRRDSRATLRFQILADLRMNARVETRRDSGATRDAGFVRPPSFLITRAAPLLKRASIITPTSQTPYWSQHTERPPRGLSRTGMLIAIASALLVIVGAIGFASFSALWHPVQHPVRATDATLQAAQALYTQATSRQPFINDTLSKNSVPATWLVDANTIGTCTFAGGSYHALVPNPASRASLCPHLAPLILGSFTYQVQMTILKGDGGGLFFGVSSVKNVFQAYLFVVDQTGSYTLEAEVPTGNQTSQGLSTELKALLHRPSSAIKTGLNQPNLLTVIAQGNRISLYINRQYVAQVSVSSPASGLMGVMALATPDPTDVAFNNAQVWP
ncbi:MAG: serine/threonine protein kinase [Chloroflexi bacterium]|nr:serine/threonine protein kinase [Chloroflexota bacterium]